MLNVEALGLVRMSFIFEIGDQFLMIKFTAVTRINKQWSLMDLQDELFRTDRAIQYK